MAFYKEYSLPWSSFSKVEEYVGIFTTEVYEYQTNEFINDLNDFPRNTPLYINISYSASFVGETISSLDYSSSIMSDVWKIPFGLSGHEYIDPFGIRIPIALSVPKSDTYIKITISDFQINVVNPTETVKVSLNSGYNTVPYEFYCTDSIKSASIIFNDDYNKISYEVGGIHKYGETAANVHLGNTLNISNIFSASGITPRNDGYYRISIRVEVVKNYFYSFDMVTFKLSDGNRMIVKD